MAYGQPITRINPTAFIILIDQSGSMAEKITYNGSVQPKAEAVADVTNALIDELINRCRRSGGIYDYYRIAVIGYSGDGVYSVLSNNGFAAPSELAVRDVSSKTISRERLLPSGRSVMLTVRHNNWIKPVSAGQTPMYEAMSKALGIIERWVSSETNRNSYPPTVFNITDGEATDSTDEMLLGLSEQIRNTHTSDGNTLFMNINIADVGNTDSVMFPSSKKDLPESRYSHLLYDMSSTMPECYNSLIASTHENLGKPPYRAMCFNSQISDLVAMLNIGSLSSSF